MRIIRLVFWSIVAILVLDLVILQILKGVQLNRAESQLGMTLKTVRQSGIQIAERYCKTLGALQHSEELPLTLQLRFISDREYVTEALCPGFSLEPLELSRSELPKFITKKDGESGFYALPTKSSQLTVEFLERELSTLPKQWRSISRTIVGGEKTLTAIDGRITATPPSDVLLESGPPTSCMGIGYQCCGVGSVSAGEMYGRATDCPKTCSARCEAVPTVLSFTGDPRSPNEARVVEIGRTQSVIFNYVLDVPEDWQLYGVLDFGDGAQEPITQANGSVAYEYRCAVASCTYIARLIPDGTLDLESVPEFDSITIRVR